MKRFYVKSKEGYDVCTGILNNDGSVIVNWIYEIGVCHNPMPNINSVLDITSHENTVEYDNLEINQTTVKSNNSKIKDDKYQNRRWTGGHRTPRKLNPQENIIPTPFEQIEAVDCSD